MCYRLSNFEVVRVNCEMFRETDDSVRDAWENPSTRMSLYGFGADSVLDVNLKRLFTSNILNYMYMNIQGLLDMFLLDTNVFHIGKRKDGVYLTRDSTSNHRRFEIVKQFRIYDSLSCRATNHFMKVSAFVHEYPGPWIVSVIIDMCEFLGGREILVPSTNRRST